jgi:hypothetical protein
VPRVLLEQVEEDPPAAPDPGTRQGHRPAPDP